MLLARVVRGVATTVPHRALPLLSSRPAAFAAVRRLSQAVEKQQAPEPTPEVSAVASAAAAEPVQAATVAADAAPEPEMAAETVPEPAASPEPTPVEAPEAATETVAAKTEPLAEQAAVLKGTPVGVLEHEIFAATKDQRYADVLMHFEALAELEGASLDRKVAYCVLEAKAVTEGTTAAMQAGELMKAQFPTLELDAGSYDAIMRACLPTGDIATAKKLYETLIASEQQPTLELYNTMIRVYTAGKDFVAAEGLFSEMRQRGVKPQRVTYLYYVNGCFRAEDAQRAYQMLLTMEEEWRVPKKEEYERMYLNFMRLNHEEGQAICREGAMQSGGSSKVLMDELPRQLRSLLDDYRANQDAIIPVYEEIKKLGIRLPRRDLQGVAMTYVAKKEPILAFRQMLSVIDAKHDPAPRMLELIGMELSTDASLVDDAYYVLDERRAEGVKVPLEAMNLIIEACAQLSDLDRAFATWQELESFGLQPNVGTFNALLHTCVRTREIGSGRRLLQRMLDAGVERDAESYFLEVGLLMRSPRDAPGCFNVLEACKAAGLVPMAKMYVTLINYCLRDPLGRKVQQAQDLLAEMEACGYPVSPALRSRVESGENPARTAAPRGEARGFGRRDFGRRDNRRGGGDN